MVDPLKIQALKTLAGHIYQPKIEWILVAEKNLMYLDGASWPY